jgi:alpha-1,2-mannosyltransferase
VAIENCDYLVDSDFPQRHEDNNTLDMSLEPRYPIMSGIWSRMDCKRFLDATNSGIFGRAFWLPSSAIDRSVWGEYCMLKRNKAGDYL